MRRMEGIKFATKTRHSTQVGRCGRRLYVLSYLVENYAVTTDSTLGKKPPHAVLSQEPRAALNTNALDALRKED